MRCESTSVSRSHSQALRPYILPLVVLAGLSAALLVAGVPAGKQLTSSRENKRAEEFSRLVAQLTLNRQQGREESEKQQEQALGILDVVVLDVLNAGGRPDPVLLNKQLAEFVSRTPLVGEDYRILALDSASTVHALVANLGVGGPSAVRLYSRPGAAARYRLAARIDRYTQKDFFDEYLDLIPVATPAVVFVTVSGRTDELRTGSFNAWQFDGQKVQLLWASDLLALSSYEDRPDGFSLSFCAEPDEEKPRECRKMSQDRYQWNGAAWKLVEHKAIPVAGH